MKKQSDSGQLPAALFAETGSSPRETQLLGDILLSSTDFVATVSPDLQLKYLNERGREMLGRPPDTDLPEKTVYEVDSQWASEIFVTEGIPSARRHGTWSGETAVAGPNGKDIAVSQLIMAHCRATPVT